MEQYGSTFKEGNLTPKQKQDRDTWRSDRRHHWDSTVKQLFNESGAGINGRLNPSEYVNFNKAYH